MEEKEIKLIVLTAKEGKEIYKISEPSIYGKIITLAEGDSKENYAVRDETVIEVEIVQ